MSVSYQTLSSRGQEGIAEVITRALIYRIRPSEETLPRWMPLLACLCALPAAGEPTIWVDPTPAVDKNGIWTPVVHSSEVYELDSESIDTILEELSGQAPAGVRLVQPLIDTPAGKIPLDSLLPDVPPPPAKGDPPPFQASELAGERDGALDGRAVYLSQCHGYHYSEALGRFTTQRGNVYDTVEDFHNPEAMNQFLTSYLENAGAAVYTTKERDHQANEVIVDNGDAGYVERGGKFRKGQPGFGRAPVYDYGENPFDMGETRVFGAASGAVASWSATVPEAGSYAIYVSWDADREHAADAHYRITHPGGTIDRWFDQRVHGSTWQYVEKLWLTPEQPVVIELIADSEDKGALLSADAIRVGGGIGNIARAGEPSGVTRWQEAAIQYTQFNGAPPSVYDPYRTGTDGSDPSARSRWAAWEHPSGEDALFLSWHSNASSGGGARGTVTYVYEGSRGAAVAGSEDLAWAVQEELIDTFRVNWQSDWADRGVKKAGFAEANPGNNPEMPAALIELAFHDNAEDVEFLKHPEFRLDASRAMYRGIVRYFAERDGVEPIFLPEPPTALALTHNADGAMVLSWQAGVSGAPYGDAPTGYLVQLSENGLAWKTPFAVSGTETVLDVAPGTTVYARVIASNDGGVSFASEVVAGMRSPDTKPAVLVVDAFDRFDTGLLEWEEAPFNLGLVRRMKLDRVNPQNTIQPHGAAIRTVGWPFDSISDERLPDIDLNKYQVVIWAAGEESSADETISADQQAQLRSYIDDGGALLVSGAEVLWDLDQKGSPSDKAFALEVLGVSLESDDAETEMASGEAILEGLILDFSAAEAPYPVEYPDVLTGSGTVLARYDSGGIAAMLTNKVAIFGIPFESVHGGAGRGEDLRAELMFRLLSALAPSYTPPELPDAPETPGEELPPARSCGCSSTGGPLPALFATLAVLIAARRRRTLHY